MTSAARVARGRGTHLSNERERRRSGLTLASRLTLPLRSVGRNDSRSPDCQ